MQREKTELAHFRVLSEDENLALDTRVAHHNSHGFDLITITQEGIGDEGLQCVILTRQDILNLQIQVKGH